MKNKTHTHKKKKKKKKGMVFIAERQEREHGAGGNRRGNISLKLLKRPAFECAIGSAIEHCVRSVSANASFVATVDQRS